MKEAADLIESLQAQLIQYQRPSETAIAARLEEIRKRCEDATPGPWKPTKSGYSVFCRIPYFSDLRIATGFERGDAEFMAHAREDIPWLLEQMVTTLRRADAAIRDLTELAEMWILAGTAKSVRAQRKTQYGSRRF